MKNVLKNLIATLLIVLAVPATASAQETTRDELAAQVRELQEKVARLEQQGSIPAADLAEIRRQIDILTRQIEELKVGGEEPTAGESGAYGLGAAASKVYRSEGGVSIGGYGEMVYENYADRDDGVASGKTDQLDFLRAILYAGYKFNDRVVFNSEIEVEHATTGGGVGEVSLEFGYLDFMLRPSFNVRAGMVLLPIGLLNELHEPTAFLGAKRPDVERTIIPSTWRENGVGALRRRRYGLLPRLRGERPRLEEVQLERDPERPAEGRRGEGGGFRARGAARLAPGAGDHGRRLPLHRRGRSGDDDTGGRRVRRDGHASASCMRTRRCAAGCSADSGPRARSATRRRSISRTA